MGAAGGLGLCHEFALQSWMQRWGSSSLSVKRGGKAGARDPSNQHPLPRTPHAVHSTARHVLHSWKGVSVCIKPLVSRKCSSEVCLLLCPFVVHGMQSSWGKPPGSSPPSPKEATPMAVCKAAVPFLQLYCNMLSYSVFLPPSCPDYFCTLREDRRFLTSSLLFFLSLHRNRL